MFRSEKIVGLTSDLTNLMSPQVIQCFLDELHAQGIKDILITIVTKQINFVVSNID